MQGTTGTALLEHDDYGLVARIYVEYRGFMFYAAGKYTQNIMDREDIVHDAFLRILNNAETLRRIPEEKLKRYLVLVVRSAYLDMKKKTSRIVPTELDDRAMEQLINRGLLFMQSPPELYAKLEIEKLSRELPKRDWSLLKGKYMLGLTAKELSILLDVEPDSIRMLLSRARSRARTILTGNARRGR